MLEGRKIARDHFVMQLMEGTEKIDVATFNLSALESHGFTSAESVFFMINGFAQLTINEDNAIINTGEILHIPDGSELTINNMTGSEIFFMIIGVKK